MVLDAAREVWAKIKEFMTRIDALETDNDETKRDAKHIHKELAILSKRVDAGEKVTDHMAKTLEEHERRIKELEKKNKGLAISAGKQKAARRRAEERAKS
jgi:uncharacterized coiled-coil DUF342 family protein